MKHRNGGKICGRHITCTDLTARVVDALAHLDGIKKVSIGKIEKAGGNSGGYVKINQAPPGRLILVIKQPRIMQKVNVFASDLDAAQEMIIHVLVDRKIPYLVDSEDKEKKNIVKNVLNFPAFT